MRNPIAVGLGAGLASAVLVLSVMTGTALAFLLNVLLPLPGLIAGLGWGLKAAIVSVASACLVITLAAGPVLQATYLIAYGLPILVLTAVVLSGRVRDPAGGEGEPMRIATRPGLVLSAATLLAGLYAGAFVLMFGTSRADYAASIRRLFDEMTKLLPPELRQGIEKLEAQQLEKLIEDFVELLPSVTAGVWLLLVLFNLLLARRILVRSGRLVELHPGLSSTDAPFLLLVTFLASVAASFQAGILGPIASGFAGAHIAAFVLIGLAVLHVLTRGLGGRVFLLTAAYGLLLVLPPVAVALLVLVALADVVLRLRERRAPPPSASPPST